MNSYKSDTPTLTKAAGERIRLARLQYNLSQDELACRVMMSRLTINNIENGKGRFESFISVMKALGELDALLVWLNAPIIEAPVTQTTGTKRFRATKRARAHKRAISL